jgi:hypothetical protein
MHESAMAERYQSDRQKLIRERMKNNNHFKILRETK